MNGVFLVIGKLGLFPNDPDPLDGIEMSVLHEDGIFVVREVKSSNGTTSEQLSHLLLADYDPDSGSITPLDPQIPEHYFHISAVIPPSPKQSASTEPASPP